MIQYEFNIVNLGETKRGKVCSKYRFMFSIKIKLSLRRFLRIGKYDKNNTFILALNLCPKLSGSRIAFKIYVEKCQNLCRIVFDLHDANHYYPSNIT